MAWELVNTIANHKQTNITLQGFYYIIGKLIDLENNLQPDPNKKIHYEAAYPDFIINETDRPTQFPPIIITYKTIDRDNAPAGSKTQVGLIKDASIWRNTETGEMLRLHLRRYKTVVRFDVFAPTATEVEAATCDFELFMDAYRNALITVGLENITYNSRGVSMGTMKNGYHNRSVMYDLITEEHLWVRDRVIDNLEIIVQDVNKLVAPDGTDLTIGGEYDLYDKT